MVLEKGAFHPENAFSIATKNPKIITHGRIVDVKIIVIFEEPHSVFIVDILNPTLIKIIRIRYTQGIKTRTWSLFDLYLIKKYAIVASTKVIFPASVDIVI